MNRNKSKTKIKKSSSSGPTNSLWSSSYKPVKLSTVALNKNPGQLFPDRLSAWMTTSVISVAASATPTYSETYKLNGIGTGQGPRVNFAGAYSANFPTGLKYLLSSNTIPGNAPYLYARIMESRIRVDIIPDVYFSAAATAPFTVAIIPTANLDFTGVSTTQICEQPLVKYKTFGPSTHGTGFRMEHSCRPPQILGEADGNFARVEDNFTFTYATDPAYLFFWQVLIRSFDGANNFSVKYQVTIESLIEFNLKLIDSTNAPTFTTVSSLKKEVELLKQVITKSLALQNPLTVDDGDYVAVKRSLLIKS